MLLQERLQSRMLLPPLLVVNQVGISLKLLLQFGTLIEKLVQTLFVILGGRNRRDRHREHHDRNCQHGSEMFHVGLSWVSNVRVTAIDMPSIVRRRILSKSAGMFLKAPASGGFAPSEKVHGMSN